MMTRSQLLILMIMAALGGSFTGILVIGIVMSEISLAVIELCIILFIFYLTYLLSGEKPNKKKRAGDIKVGGEVLPEFKN